jgi:TetR/AcrR family transcriptional repressor of nem operon
MPWEKNFDLDDALDKAMVVFWNKGYDGTSMTDLINAMEIKKGSLYNAFGSKDQLFNRVLLRYDQQVRQKRFARLRDVGDTRKIIKKFFEDMVCEAIEDDDKKGCFLINTALNLPNQPIEIQKIVTEALIEIEEFFMEMIEKDQKEGRLDKNIDAKEKAKSILALIVGLRVLARGTYEPQSLEAIKSQAVGLLED